MRTLPDFRRNLDFAERVAFSKPVPDQPINFSDHSLCFLTFW